MTFNEIRERLQKLDTACLCDVNKEIRALDPAIRPIRPDLQLVGRAHTVTCSDDFLTVLKALKEATRGEVLVVDGQQGHKALAGELFTTEALRKNLAGLVVDGAVRDSETLSTINLPVYARFVFPISGTTSHIYATQVPISCGGVSVYPGDILFGDHDGIIVASQQELIELIPLAEEIQKKEALVLRKIRQGESLIEMLNFDEHLANVSAGKHSQLKFNL